MICWLHGDLVYYIQHNCVDTECSNLKRCSLCACVCVCVCALLMKYHEHVEGKSNVKKVLMLSIAGAKGTGAVPQVATWCNSLGLFFNCLY
jgi:hypothetical protein